MTFEELLKIDTESRDQAWEAAFLAALSKVPARVISPDPSEGPDHWPYLMVEVGHSQGDSSAVNAKDDSIENIVGWLSTRGIGLVVNPTKAAPDYVLTYGMICNYRERGEFLTTIDAPAKAGLFEVKDGQQLWVGVPTEQFLPAYVRKVLKQFLADQSIFAPKCLMVSTDNKNFDLCFSVESMKSPPVLEHSNIAEALSWFLPAHYSVSLLSEKTVTGFAPV
jgi:hypothetical protein